MIAASYLEPGLITVTTPGPTYIGGPAAELVEQLIGADAPLVLTDNFEGAQWTKLFINQVNALPAITGLYVQQVIADDGLRRVLTASMRETVRVAVACGVHFATIKPLTHWRLRLFALVPAYWAERLPRGMAQRMGSVPNPGSTLQSIRRGQKTEIDFLNGAVVAHGVAPINAELTAMVHEVEASGVFLTPAQVVARVSLVGE
jgi:2-dehydropantoate 2-reductase